MTYDKHTFSYDIAVTYNAAEGTLSAKVADGSQAGSATFTNIYEAEDTKDVINTEEPATSVNGKIVGVGDQLTYTIDWVNNAVDETGAPAKAEVKITDIVPKGTEYVSADTNGVYEETSKTITWTLGEQEAGAFGTVSFVVKVLTAAGGTAVENTAEITIGDNDPNQTNTVTTNVPGKDSVVEGDGELQVGKVLTYTISYKNPEIEAATVIITDSIPEGLDYVDDSAGEYASYNAETRMLTWKIADVQPGADGTVTFDARVNESIFFRQCRTFGILKRYYKCKLFLFVDPCALTFCQYDGFTDGKISIFRNLFPIGIRLIFRSIFADLDRRFVLNYCLGAFIYSSIKCNRSVCSWLNICRDFLPAWTEGSDYRTSGWRAVYGN